MKETTKAIRIEPRWAGVVAVLSVVWLLSVLSGRPQFPWERVDPTEELMVKTKKAELKKRQFRVEGETHGTQR